MTGQEKPLALVTGGQRGIGFGIAQKLVNDGYRLALMAERPTDHPEVTGALSQLGNDARYYVFDQSRGETAADVVAEVISTQGPITVFVANAGVGALSRGDMLDITPEAYDFCMDINAKGTFFLAQAVAAHMVTSETNHKSMIFISSVSAEMVSIERAEYCLSKATLGMMVPLFADRLAADGIGVFEVRPGVIATDMTAGVKEKYDARIADGLVPAQRWGYPADIADTVSSLATGKMAFATGSVLRVDGGLSIPRL